MINDVMGVFGFVELEVYCALILVVLLPTTIIYNKKRKKGTNGFIIVMYLSFFIMIIADIALMLLRYYKSDGTVKCYTVFATVFLLGYCLSGYFWFLTCESEIATILYQDKLMVCILSIPALLSIGIILANIYNSMIFSFDVLGHYFRYSGFYIVFFINIFYLALSITHAIYFAYNHDDSLYRKEYQVIAVVGCVFLASCLLHGLAGVDCLCVGATGGIALYYQVITAGLNYREERRARQREDFLKADNKNLALAVGTVYTLVFSVNLSANKYHVLSHDGSMALRIPNDGAHDDLIRGGMMNIGDKEDRDHFYEVLYRENQIAAYKKGARRLTLRYREMGADGCPHLVETVVIFLENTVDVQQITFVKNIDESPLGNKDFWSMISKDIRNPINTVIGMTEIAANQPEDKDRNAEYFTKIGLILQHLLSLTGDVVDYNNINNGMSSVNLEMFNLNDFVANVMNIVDGQLIGRNIELVRDISIKHFKVFGDEDKLKRVIIYILGNSIKFTPDGGKVSFEIKEISCNEYKVRFKIVITDNGVGMKPEFVQRIWDPFSQENCKLRANYQGTGLGMVIAKRYIEMMGGSALIVSEPGKGSIFTIDISFGLGMS